MTRQRRRLATGLRSTVASLAVGVVGPAGRAASSVGVAGVAVGVAGVATGVVVGLIVGGWPGATVGVSVTPVAWLVLRRVEPPARRRERLAAAAELPIAADLLAAALRAGAPMAHAAQAVGAALGGPLGARLGLVARSLSDGAAPAEAWAHLADVTGAARLVRAAVRSAESGAALGGALGRLGEDLRAARAAAAEAAARRVGVLAVLPLGLCFLPAFVLTGVVPVVVAVLGDAFH
jgi:Flp pilus assembly protein TadB